MDLWYSVPTGVAYQRMMPRRKRPRLEWDARLDPAFGDQGWRRLHEERADDDLLEGTRVTVSPAGGIRLIEDHVIERLRTAFAGVASQVGELRNSKGQLYSLVFYCANPAPTAQKAAMRIASHILAQK